MTYEEYAHIRDSKGYTDYKVSKETGVSRATLSEWKNGKYSPKTDKINAIKEFFGILEKKEMPEFEMDHIELIDLYSKLTKEQKTVVMNLLRSFVPQD